MLTGDEAMDAQPLPPVLSSKETQEVPAMFPKSCSGTCEKPPELKTDTILDEAARITSTDRNQTYGPPRDNHSRTAALWQAYLSGLNGRSLDYRDVCWLNVLQKASRDVFHRSRDSLVDGAGYLRNAEMADNDEGRA